MNPTTHQATPAARTPRTYSTNPSKAITLPDGRVMGRRAAAKALGISYPTLMDRLSRGAPLQAAVTRAMRPVLLASGERLTVAEAQKKFGLTYSQVRTRVSAAKKTPHGHFNPVAAGGATYLDPSNGQAYTVSQIAKMTGVTKGAIYAAIANGGCPFARRAGKRDREEERAIFLVDKRQEALEKGYISPQTASVLLGTKVDFQDDHRLYAAALEDKFETVVLVRSRKRVSGRIFTILGFQQLCWYSFGFTPSLEDLVEAVTSPQLKRLPVPPKTYAAVLAEFYVCAPGQSFIADFDRGPRPEYTKDGGLSA